MRPAPGAPSRALIQVHCLLAARPTRVNVDKRGIMGAIRPILVFRCRAVSPIITQSLCGPPCLTRPAGSVITSPEDREQKKALGFLKHRDRPPFRGFVLQRPQGPVHPPHIRLY